MQGAGVGSGKPCCENSLRIACAHQWPLYPAPRRKLRRACHDHSSSPCSSTLCHPRNRQLRQEPLSQGTTPHPSITVLLQLLFQFELMGCEDVPPQERHLGFNNGFPICVDNEPPAFRCYFIANCFFAQFNLANWQITRPRWCYSQPHATHSGTALPTRSWYKSHPMAFSFPSTSPSPLQWITLEVLQGLTSSRRVSPFP